MSVPQWRYIFGGPNPRRHIGMSFGECHYSLDLSNDEGVDILCPADGYLISCGEDSSVGNYIVIRTSPVNGVSYYVRIIHMQNKPTFTNYPSVHFFKAGDVLGQVGKTPLSAGYAPHVHMDVSITRSWPQRGCSDNLNPRDFFAGSFTTDWDHNDFAKYCAIYGRTSC